METIEEKAAGVEISPQKIIKEKRFFKEGLSNFVGCKHELRNVPFLKGTEEQKMQTALHPLPCPQ